jgi:hypothetical protein
MNYRERACLHADTRQFADTTRTLDKPRVCVSALKRADLGGHLRTLA